MTIIILFLVMCVVK